MKSRLTPKQEMFALAYCCMSNASDAYRHVYAPRNASAKTINEAASRLLNNSKIAARIAETITKAADKTALTLERTLREIARICYADVRQLFDEHGRALHLTELNPDIAAAILVYEVREKFDKNGKVVASRLKIKLHDKAAMLELALRHLGIKRGSYRRKPTEPIVVNPPSKKPMGSRSSAVGSG